MRKSTLAIVSTMFALIFIFVYCDKNKVQVKKKDTVTKKTEKWSLSLSKEKKMKFMEKNILPAATKILTGFAKEVKCSTCHGPNAMKGEFKVGIIHPLDSKNPFNVPDDKKKILEVMKTKMVPQIAEILGKKPQPAGKFGCFTCHARKL